MVTVCAYQSVLNYLHLCHIMSYFLPIFTGKCEFQEMEKILWSLSTNLPFKARVVSPEILEAEEREAGEKEKRNINPFTFEYCAENNVLGCQKWLSPYDYVWKGKYQ